MEWAVYRVYADEGISGKDIKGRPAIREMIGDVEAGRVKNVLVFKIDRLTRSTADLIYMIDLFNRHGCAFNSLMESIDTQTASGRMFLKIIGIFAEFERENIVERTKLGVERKVKEGYSLCTAMASFGYDRRAGQKIQSVNEAEAGTVAEIFDMFVSGGLTLTDIARRLNLRDIKTKTDKTWTSTKVRRVLQNCNYVGSVRHHVADKKRNKTWDGLHDAIIPRELFDEAAAMLRANQKHSLTDSPSEDKYFAGFLVCAKCGYRLKTYNTRKRLKSKTQYTSGYLCGNRTLGACAAASMSHKKAEAAFADYISRIADFAAADDPQLTAPPPSRPDNAGTVTLLENKLRALEYKEHETLELYVRNELDFGEYREMKKTAAADKLLIQAEIDRLQALSEPAPAAHEDIIANLRANWDLLSQAERRAFLKKFVDTIEIVSEKAEGEFFGNVRIVDVKWREG